LEGRLQRFLARPQRFPHWFEQVFILALGFSGYGGEDVEHFVGYGRKDVAHQKLLRQGVFYSLQE
jgi:hypothetical protein